MNLNEEKFRMLKEKNVVFPVICELNGDELTPINIFYNLQGENKIIMESSEFAPKKGRYSFIASDPYMKVKSFGEAITVEKENTTFNVKGKIIDYMKSFLEVDYEKEFIDTPFAGGAIGYSGYDIIKQYEKISQDNFDDLNIPEAYFMLYKKFICYDHLKHNVIFVYNVFHEDLCDYEEVCKYLSELRKQIIKKTSIHNISNNNTKYKFTSNCSKENFCRKVDKAKEYIKKGDIFQVVISQRIKCRSDLGAFDIYRKLRHENPSPYLFYMDFGTFQIVGSSPERLVSVQEDVVVTNPIAGTRRRGMDKFEDKRLEKELLENEKERAEHVMLVDLGRNDIGRVSEFGSVSVTRFMEVEKYSHIMHMVSEVSGKLKKDISSFDAFVACLPAGTVSGAPKIRAMEIIDEIEDRKRLLYAGAVGYFSYNKNMDMCIAIRSLVFKDSFAYIQSGGGIVYDSNPEDEYEESMNKAKALMEVV